MSRRTGLSIALSLAFVATMLAVGPGVASLWHAAQSGPGVRAPFCCIAKEHSMSRRTSLSIGLSLAFVVTMLAVRPGVAATEDASPITGTDGGTLYTYGTGEAGFFT